MNVDTVNDIEDLMDFGNRHQCCPYYAARKIAEVKASVVFMPYNYLLDPKLRKSLPLKIKNSIIIIDEAHNIQSFLRDCVSASVKASCLKTVVESCHDLPSRLAEAMNKERYGLSRTGYDPSSKRGGIVNELSTKKSSRKEEEPKVSFMEDLAEKLTTEKLQQVRTSAELLRAELEKEITKSTYCETDLLFNYLRSAGIEYSTSDPIVTTLDSMISFWSTAGVMNPDKVARHVNALTNFKDLVSVLYPDSCFRLQLLDSHKKELLTHFKGFCKTIYNENTPIDRGGSIVDIEVNLWCLNPAIGLQRTFSSESLPRSIIFTSGTLSPMESMARALNFNPGSFVMEGFTHVINDTQMKMLIVEKSPNAYSLSARFEDAEKPQYSIELGKTLIPLFELLPFGTLVFFPSYSRMKRVIDAWKYRFIWREMEKHTKLFVEPAASEECDRIVADFRKAVSPPEASANRRAVFFGVCRGKLSEGTNLEGDQCRTVILAGVPYPNTQDPRVKAIRSYRDIHKNPDGSMWYSEQMKLALYQTIGRVIRSRTDFGLVLLCDPRFSMCKYGAPRWMEKYYPSEPTSSDNLGQEIKSFFKIHNQEITSSLQKRVIPQPPELRAPAPDPAAKIRDMINGYRNAKRMKVTQENESPQEPEAVELEPEVAPPKRKSLNIFKKKEQQNEYTSSNYSILNRPIDVNGPAAYRCYICKNPAQNPHRTECPCQHSGCRSCLMILAGKNCGRCKTLITQFKKLYFRSAVHKTEKV